MIPFVVRFPIAYPVHKTQKARQAVAVLAPGLGALNECIQIALAGSAPGQGAHKAAIARFLDQEADQLGQAQEARFFLPAIETLEEGGGALAQRGIVGCGRKQGIKAALALAARPKLDQLLGAQSADGTS